MGVVNGVPFWHSEGASEPLNLGTAVDPDKSNLLLLFLAISPLLLCPQPSLFHLVLMVLTNIGPHAFHSVTKHTLQLTFSTSCQVSQ